MREKNKTGDEESVQSPRGVAAGGNGVSHHRELVCDGLFGPFPWHTPLELSVVELKAITVLLQNTIQCG